MRKYILIILVCLVIIGIILRIQGRRTIVNLNNDFKKQEELIRKYQNDTGIIPGSVAMVKLKESISSNEKDFRKVLSLFDTVKKDLPADVSDKGIYFFESLHTCLKELEREATAKKMILPPVDFSVDVPREEDIPYLLKQIEMIQDIMGIILDAGKCEITTIRPNPIDKTKKFLDFDKLGIQIILNIDSDSLAKVLSDMNSHVPLYLIEEFSASVIEQNKLKVSLVVSRILTGISVADIGEFKSKDSFDLDSLYPLDLDFKSFSKRNPFFRKQQEVAKDAALGGSAAKGAKTTPQFTYKGNMFMDKKTIAIIEDNWQGKACFAAEGDVCSGYKVTKIEGKRVILSKDNQELILLKGANNE
ncbi:MAG: hypothetical protein PHS93_01160 [Candidatus Omnitrophica bacterium]|nr:hypothetical protein [Candidatus Omnitrophota bacterium]MDD5351761.1 hypothetical protein [Candidatus Omnitrophota bacterium]MDD5550972.1 hypothetical protein [Candidatus Omnitrophota bacterium]